MIRNGGTSYETLPPNGGLQLLQYYFNSNQEYSATNIIRQAKPSDIRRGCAGVLSLTLVCSYPLLPKNGQWEEVPVKHTLDAQY